ncbi:MAG TPA: hypothetical protein VGI81_13940 [Tepidisphaeraceae bacterium]|jgi:peptidoglycan/xylan/chitin deacetylase (PgdA/CDA1 family)
MGVAFYPVLNPAIVDYQPHLLVNGKAIAKAMPLLESWAKEVGVRPLYDFYSESTEEVFAKIGEPVPPGTKDEPIKWAEPDDGIKTVRAMLERLRSEPGPALSVTDERGRERSVSVEQLIRDLEAFESVFRRASDHGSKFRLRIDI